MIIQCPQCQSRYNTKSRKSDDAIQCHCGVEILVPDLPNWQEAGIAQTVAVTSTQKIVVVSTVMPILLLLVIQHVLVLLLMMMQNTVQNY